MENVASGPPPPVRARGPLTPAENSAGLKFDDDAIDGAEPVRDADDGMVDAMCCTRRASGAADGDAEKSKDRMPAMAAVAAAVSREGDDAAEDGRY